MAAVDREIARVQGTRIVLRLVQPEDASYVFRLRTDPRYNRYLSKVKGSVDDQKSWIEKYKDRESLCEEYYYVIERLDGAKCGLVRLYDISHDEFLWGSWILEDNKPRKAALESAFLVYRVAFDNLELKRATFDVMRENVHTINFHLRFGAKIIGEDKENYYFEYLAGQFREDAPRIRGILEAEIE